MAQGREAATEAEVLAVLRPCPDEWLKIWPVERKVGNVNSTGLQQFEVLNILIEQDHVFVAIAELRIKAIEVKGVQRLSVSKRDSRPRGRCLRPNWQGLSSRTRRSSMHRRLRGRCARHSSKPGG
jgi:hypothetical protein